MAALDIAVLSPRKLPRQARSKAMVDAVFEATIQVLLVDGLRRLTTIRVAERAGTSVGTLYQYYPNKQALLYRRYGRPCFGAASRHASSGGHHEFLPRQKPA